MAHANAHFKKVNEIKVRVDDFEDERLKKYINSFGGEPAVIARDALIQFLDQSQILYSEKSLNIKLDERLQVLAVKQGVRNLHKQLIVSNNEKAHSKKTA